MANPVAQKILAKIGEPNLINKLVESCSGSELNSLLIELFNKKVSNISSNDLLKMYSQNRFVDWTQKLTSNKKELMLISGLGLELLMKMKEGWI